MGFLDMFDRGFSIFFLFFILIFLLVMVGFVVILVKMISSWHKNNQSPRLTVAARVVAKRTDYSHHHGHRDHSSHHISTWYYVTFQVDSGDRMEFCVSGSQYGMLIEGDQGMLTFQGARFLSFSRG